MPASAVRYFGYGWAGFVELSMEPMIPGNRDETTLTHRQPGAMGGDPSGADIPPVPPQWEDDAIRKEYERDGGGAPRERKQHD